MCVGEAAAVIFSVKFNNLRSEAHQITIDKYNQITLKPLQMLFENQFSHIFLWFDDDMFCQINLLTILAYLDQNNYNSKITFNLINREFILIDSFEFTVQGYYEIYKQVLINRRMPEGINLSVMRKSIKLYLEYLKEDNEIISYINQHEDLQSNALLLELLKRFTQYGLGDTQYIQLIEICRKV